MKHASVRSEEQFTGARSPDAAQGFSWKVVSYNDNKIDLKFTYDHPKYISVGKPDTMKISFYNTEAWVVPLNE